MDGSCDCGRVRFHTPSVLPVVIFECHCSQCPTPPRKRDGGFAWCAVKGICDIRSNGGLSWRRSSRFAHRGRCDTCGSMICLRYDCEESTDWVPLRRQMTQSSSGQAVDMEGVPVRRIHRAKRARTPAVGADADDIPSYTSWQPWEPDPCRDPGTAPPTVCFRCFLTTDAREQCGSNIGGSPTSAIDNDGKGNRDGVGDGDNHGGEGRRKRTRRRNPQRQRSGVKGNANGALLPRNVCTCPDGALLSRPFS